MKHFLLYAKPIRLFWSILSLLTVTTLTLVACGSGGATTTLPIATTAPTLAPTTAPTIAPNPHIVQIKIVEKNSVYSFEPATITVPKGTEIIWTNTSDAPHTVTSDTGAFNTPNNLTQNQTFMATFPTAGTFTYHCNIHPNMKATITVTS